MRFLRDKLEEAASEQGTDGEKASQKQVSGTRYQLLGKEVFSYHCSVRASFSLYELDKLNEPYELFQRIMVCVHGNCSPEFPLPKAGVTTQP